MAPLGCLAAWVAKFGTPNSDTWTISDEIIIIASFRYVRNEVAFTSTKYSVTKFTS